MTKDHTHLPENVQAILKALPVHDQVVLRSYSASLRENVKDSEHKLLAEEDEDPHGAYQCLSLVLPNLLIVMHMRPHHFSLYFLYFVLAHYHGHEKCTSDHGHDSHSHHAKEEACTDGGHEHSHSHKKEEDAACGEGDGHDHGAFCRLRC